MRCEVCGREIFGQPYYRIIEGGRMTVCGGCAKFSTQEWDPRKPRARPITRRTGGAPRPPRPRSDVEATEQLELIDDYGIAIKKARQKKGLSVEDFAKKISEKESVVKKLEKEELNPPEKLVQKLERALGIKLMERATQQTGSVLTRPMGARTLGDVIKIKMPDDEEED